jgi:hypothetical protein
LFGQLERSLEISASVAGWKTEKLGGGDGGGTECGDDVAGLEEKTRRSLEILSEK